MKKYLSILCTLLVMASFVSCVDSDDDSEISINTVSESTTEETTAEETTTEEIEPETTTEKTTEPVTENTTEKVSENVETEEIIQTETETEEVTELITEPITEEETQPVTELLTEIIETQPPVVETPPPPQPTTLHFILNLETNCIHINSGCTAAQAILPENRAEIDISESDLESYYQTYWACGRCSKIYSDILPKF